MDKIKEENKALEVDQEFEDLLEDVENANFYSNVMLAVKALLADSAENKMLFGFLSKKAINRDMMKDDFQILFEAIELFSQKYGIEKFSFMGSRSHFDIYHSKEVSIRVMEFGNLLDGTSSKNMN